MFIIELTTLEPKFIEESTKCKECAKTRSFDIDHKAAMYVYYYTEHVQIQLIKYGNHEMITADWEIIKRFPILLSDIDISKPMRISRQMEDDYLDIYLPYKNAQAEKRNQ